MCTQSQLVNFLREKNLLNEIYEAMESDDYSDVVMVVLKLYENHNIMLHPRREKKCAELSDKHRNEGNEAFKKGDSLLAIHHYNRALRYAPNKSRAMVLAYSNRSAVLFTTGNFAECLSDIETCNRLGCPPDIVDKINKRKELASAKIFYKNFLDEIRASYKKTFQIVNRNAEVPCASADVDIVVNDGAAKITAANDIKVGSVLAAESTFVSYNSFQVITMDTACRHCFSTSFTLIPCDGCCFVMFCSEKCKRKCQQEYHNIECQIMEVVAAMELCSKTRLMMTGAIKFVQMCGTWEEAIKESQCTGSKRRRVSNASEMFDGGNKLSILNYEEDNIFIHGNMYEYSLICAKIIDSLDRVPSYFPKSSSERVLAKRALSRVMMYLALYAKPSRVSLIEQASLRLKDSFPIKSSSYALCTFIGKVENSCTPNAIVSYICDKIVLIALKPIRKGSELTVSHCGHYFDSNISSHERNFESFMLFGRVCNCFVCSNEWRTRGDVLTEEQIAFYKNYIEQHRSVNPEVPLQNYSKLCEVLTCLSTAPFSKEYNVVYDDFRERLMVYSLICEVCQSALGSRGKLCPIPSVKRTPLPSNGMI